MPQVLICAEAGRKAGLYRDQEMRSIAKTLLTECQADRKLSRMDIGVVAKRSERSFVIFH